MWVLANVEGFGWVKISVGKQPAYLLQFVTSERSPQIFRDRKTYFESRLPAKVVESFFNTMWRVRGLLFTGKKNLSLFVVASHRRFLNIESLAESFATVLRVATIIKSLIISSSLKNATAAVPVLRLPPTCEELFVMCTSEGVEIKEPVIVIGRGLISQQCFTVELPAPERRYAGRWRVERVLGR